LADVLHRLFLDLAVNTLNQVSGHLVPFCSI